MPAEERRRAILEALCRRRHETRENLAFEFGVSKRTIEYDIMRLSADYPVYTTQGKGGGIHIMEGYRLDRKYLSDKQIALLKSLKDRVTGEEAETIRSIIKAFGLPGQEEEKR